MASLKNDPQVQELITKAADKATATTKKELINSIKLHAKAFDTDAPKTIKAYTKALLAHLTA